MQTRRNFFKKATLAAAAVSAAPALIAKGVSPSAIPAMGNKEADLFFDISLVEWSLNSALFGGKLDNLDFPAYTKE